MEGVDIEGKCITFLFVKWKLIYRERESVQEYLNSKISLTMFCQKMLSSSFSSELEAYT